MDHNILPPGFVILQAKVPLLLFDLKYTGNDNIIGRPLKGYAKDGVAVLTEIAAKALEKIAEAIQTPSMLKKLGVSNPKLLIYDAYRPQMGSDDFWEWGQSSCIATKSAYYPNLDKKDLFKLGYIARQSSHSRGSTIDLTLVDYCQNQIHPLDMGTPFDFMDVLSHPENRDVSECAYQNRQILRELMTEFGFVGIEEEWWHFTYQNEPYSETYFNFPVLNYKV